MYVNFHLNIKNEIKDMIWIPQCHYEISLGLGFREAKLIVKPTSDIGRMWAWVLGLSASIFAACPDFTILVTLGGSWTCISISRAGRALWECLQVSAPEAASLNVLPDQQQGRCARRPSLLVLPSHLDSVPTASKILSAEEGGIRGS